MPRLSRAAFLAAVLAFTVVSSALADGSAGSDPPSDYPAGALPDSCHARYSPQCVDASVAYLDRARANLGQRPYRLPSNFDSLTPAERGFVLADLDRLLYGLRPAAGMTAALDQDALAGVHGATDPQPSASDYTTWTANWAGGYNNMTLAYEAWMYDDGPGSTNLDCTRGNPSGCWGHRHNVLWEFAPSGPLAMGVAAGTGPNGDPGYAMLLFGGDSTYRPVYVYTWAQAVAAGAGAAGSASRPRPVSVRLIVRGPGRISDGRGHTCHRARCSFTEPADQAVHLSERPDMGARFTRWGAGCSGRRRSCAASASSPAPIVASFSRARSPFPDSSRAHPGPRSRSR